MNKYHISFIVTKCQTVKTNQNIIFYKYSANIIILHNSCDIQNICEYTRLYIIYVK